jgi:hypothetical protein
MARLEQEEEEVMCGFGRGRDLGEEDALGGHELDEVGRRSGLLGEEAALLVLYSEGQGILADFDLCREWVQRSRAGGC